MIPRFVRPRLLPVLGVLFRPTITSKRLLAADEIKADVSTKDASTKEEITVLVFLIPVLLAESSLGC